MIKATALIIEPIDRTKDGNLKSQVFDAICAADIVIDGNRVVKNNPPSSIRQPAEDKPVQEPEPYIIPPASSTEG